MQYKTADAKTIIDWQLKCLTEQGTNLSASEINLLISFEEQFKKKGILSSNQMIVLEEIYKRRT